MASCRLTRAEFAADNQLFRLACQMAGMRPSRHQAKRWRLGQGTAYAFLGLAKEMIAVEDAAVRFSLDTPQAAR